VAPSPAMHPACAHRLWPWSRHLATVVCCISSSQTGQGLAYAAFRVRWEEATGWASSRT
jgi:hypothetical protein